ncbi:MAG: DNA alkylation repair protein [bacterium]|nr:DNA alkylation repair protein [bacterium]
MARQKGSGQARGGSDKAQDVRRALARSADPHRANVLQRYFKTAPGEYAAGDRFIGLTVPATRRVVERFRDLAHSQVLILLRSPIHEERLAALLIMGEIFIKAQAPERAKIYTHYLANTRYVNNWDLVDSSAHYIVGEYLADKSKTPLARLAKSGLLWERRIAIVATAAFIQRGDFKPTLRLSVLLLKDQHDLIHKAVGWMLREVGKKDTRVLLAFLDRYAHRMPRTALRYSLERLTPAQKRRYMGQGRYMQQRRYMEHRRNMRQQNKRS